jgi:hypothetical protein
VNRIAGPSVFRNASFHWFHITANSDVAFRGGSETFVSRRAWDSVGATCLSIGAGQRSLETGTGRGRETGSQPASASVGHPRELWRFGLLGHAASIGRELCRLNPAERPAAAACPYRKPKTAVSGESVDNHLRWVISPGRRGGCPPRPPQIRTCPIRASGSSRERFVPSGVAVNDLGRWQRVTDEERVEVVPFERPSACSTFQPLVPDPHDLIAIFLNPTRDAVVGVVTVEYCRQPGALFACRPVPVGPAPGLDRGQR